MGLQVAEPMSMATRLGEPTNMVTRLATMLVVIMVPPEDMALEPMVPQEEMELGSESTAAGSSSTGRLTGLAAPAR